MSRKQENLWFSARMGEKSQKNICLWRHSFRILALVFVAGATLAVMPMSPRLEQETRLKLIADLMRAGMTENATSSVERVLESVLIVGEEPLTETYRTGAPQLFFIDGRSTLAHEGCMDVQLDIWMAPRPDDKIVLTGTFCRTDRPGDYYWRAEDYTIKGVF
jgi:hypothetical protein